MYVTLSFLQMCLLAAGMLFSKGRMDGLEIRDKDHKSWFDEYKNTHPYFNNPYHGQDSKEDSKRHFSVQHQAYLPYFKKPFSNHVNNIHSTFKNFEKDLSKVKKYKLRTRKSSNKSHNVRTHQHVSKGCRAADLCCQGKDNRCITRGARMNGNNNDTCYCDSTCLSIGDCCTDHTEHCRAMGCKLGAWGKWSQCDTACGFGMRQRTRRVEQEARNGAPACTITSQTQLCEGMYCKVTRNSGTREEEWVAAKILPMRYAKWREDHKYDPLKDIRSNIYHYLGHNAIKRSRHNYCGVYRLQYMKTSCQGLFELRPHGQARTRRYEKRHQVSMTKGFGVCVECQHTAINGKLEGRCSGHGVRGKQTKWSMLQKRSCRGTWVLQERRKPCSCSQIYPHLPAFIFV